MRAPRPAVSVRAASRRAVPRGVVLAVVLALVVADAGQTVTAAPPDSTAQEAAHQAFSAIVADVDGDGVRELVQISPRADNGSQLAVEVSSIDPVGNLVSHGQAPLRRGVTPDTLETPGSPPEDGLIPASSHEPARLLAWRQGGKERVLAVVVGNQREPRACCLTVWRVEITDSRATQLRLVADAQLAADAVAVVDLDGDATDELVVAEPPSAARPDQLVLNVLAWRSGAFERRQLSVAGSGRSPLYLLGETDGQPGDELAFSTVVELDGQRHVLHRLAMRSEGSLRIDRYQPPVPAEPVTIAGPDGPLIAMVAATAGVQLLRWPAEDERPTMVVESPRRGIPLSALGSGAAARLYLLIGGGVAVRSLDASLTAHPRVSGSPASAAFREPEVRPYVGPIPGGLPDGRPAIVFRGQLLPDPGSVPRSAFVTAVTPMATLPGISPVGVLGPDGGWTALAASAGFDAARAGGELSPIRQRTVSLRVARSSTVFSPESDGGRLDLEIVGGVPDARDPDRAVLLAAGPFDARVAAPPGSLASAVADVAGVESAAQRVGRSGTLALPLRPAQQTAALPPRFGLRIDVITPAGHGYTARYQVRIVTDPPGLEATAPFAPLGPEVTIHGRTEPGATLQVDGQPVAVQADGSFAASVPAGLLPRSVRLEARDQVGNVRSAIVSVVMPIDYRRLPWIPIVGTLMLLITLVLYLRTQPLVQAARPRAGEGTLEEIDEA